MAVVNIVDLPEDSPSRSIDSIPLPEDHVVETQVEEQGKDSNDEEEGLESLESKELSKHIDSYVVVLDDDNLSTAATTLDPDVVQPIVTLSPSPSNPLADQEAPTSTPPITDTTSVQIFVFIFLFFSFLNSMYFLKWVDTRVLNYFSYYKFIRD